MSDVAHGPLVFSLDQYDVIPILFVGIRGTLRDKSLRVALSYLLNQSSTSGNIFLLKSDKTHVALDYSQLMYIIKGEHTWTWNVKTWSELAMSSITRCTAMTGKIAESWSRLWSQVTCLTSRRPSTPVIRIPVNWWSLFNIQEFHFILHLHNLCIHFLVDLVTLHDYEGILLNWIFKFHSMVAYFCHHIIITSQVMAEVCHHTME